MANRAPGSCITIPFHRWGKFLVRKVIRDHAVEFKPGPSGCETFFEEQRRAAAWTLAGLFFLGPAAPQGLASEFQVVLEGGHAWLTRVHRGTNAGLGPALVHDHFLCGVVGGAQDTRKLGLPLLIPYCVPLGQLHPLSEPQLPVLK